MFSIYGFNFQLFYFLVTTNKTRTTVKENRNEEERKYSTVVQLDQNGKSSVQTNQELVVIQANGEVELTLDLIDKCPEGSDHTN